MAAQQIRLVATLVAGLVALSACSAGASSGAVTSVPTASVSAPPSDTAPSVTARSESSPTESSPTARAAVTASTTVEPATTAASAAPDCTPGMLQVAINTGRGADAQLTVGSDFHCAQDWAVAGGTDTVNKAQYTFLLRWVDGAWQPVDRTEACAGQDIPTELTALACHSN